MKNKYLIKLLAILVAINSLFTSCTVRTNNKEENQDIQAFIDEVNNSEKHVFSMVSDTTNVEAEVDKLGIIEDNVYLYGSYKVMIYRDQNDMEKTCILIPFLNYIVDEEGNVVDEEYLMYNPFNQRLIIVLGNVMDRGISKIDIENHEETGYIKKIIKLGGLDLLRKNALDKGMSEEYVDSVFKPTENMNQRLISVSEVGRLYVLLVNRLNRETFERNESLILD